MNNGDMSDVFEKLNSFTSENPEMVNNLLNMLNNSNQNNQSNTTSDSSNSKTLDIKTIMKMKSIIDSINTKDDPRSNLLLSLKPYLNDSRKSKVDQYIQLMNMSKVLDVFPFMGGGTKK